MTDEQAKSAPLPSVRRLPSYLRFLLLLQSRGRNVVSCTQIASELGLIPVQVRKDLAVTGIVGKPKVGYKVHELIAAIRDFLGWNNTTDAFLVGAGCLGSALLGYEGFHELNLNLVAAFDIDPTKIGTPIHGKEIFSIEKLGNLVQRMHALIGVLTVPAAAAQDATNLMVSSGMRAIWNYTPVRLEVPENVIVEDVRLASSLAVLSSRLAKALRTSPADALPAEAETQQQRANLELPIA
jgi:redox-sensing transcriptional repressor